jgi:DNA-binding NarL/FixJ family response regulator
VRSALRLLLALEPDVTVVGEACDKEEALELVVIEQPDVVVLDWDLPDQGGGIALAELKAKLPSLAVVAVSTLPEARQVSLDAGAEAFVSKGGPPERLLATIERIRNSSFPK